MSSTSELETATETRTKVDTEEVTLYKCPAGCGQHVEEEELVPVKVGEGADQVETIACEYCAHSQYGYDGDAANASVEEIIESTANSFADQVAMPLARSVIPLSLTVGSVLYAFSAVTDMLTQTRGSEEILVETAAVVEVVGPLLPILLGGLVLVTMMRLMVIGPRM